MGDHRKRGEQLTTRRPVHLTTREISTLTVDLEPHITTSIPVSSRLALWHFRKVELQGSWVRDAGHGCEADRVSGVDSVSF